MIGKNFRGFQIIKLLGKGGTGEVYLAHQQDLGRAVALKITPTSHPILIQDPEKPLKEAKVLASIQHPNIVSIYEVGKEQDFFYIAIEYISKGSLKQDIERNVISELQMWSMSLQICQALEAALQEGITHSDIKPENILLHKNNFVKLTDFGISEIVEEIAQNENFVLGTPGYISPEKFSGEGEDFRSDIYSLGCTIYYALTGQFVFLGETPYDIQEKHQNLQIKPPSMHNSSLSYETNIILAKMLHKKPEDRYQSYGDLMFDIQLLLQQRAPRFATMRDAKKIFLNANTYVINKKVKISQKIKVFTENMLYYFNCPDDLDLLIVGEWPIQEISKNFPTFDRLHFMGSISEVLVYLKRKRAIIILDCEYLDYKIIQFCSLLRENHCDAYIIIYSKDIPAKLYQNNSLPIISDQNLQEQLNQIINNNNLLKTPQQIDLQPLITLAQNKYWSFIVEVYKNNCIQAKINMDDGHIANIEIYDSKDLLLEEVLENNDGWVFRENSYDFN